MLGVLLGSGVPLTVGEAAPLVVTSLADPGTGGCTPADCTLREAIAAAPAGATITFAPALFTAGPGTIVLTAGELLLNKDMTIRGPGQQLLSLSGNRASRVVRIPPDIIAKIEQVTIKRGRAKNDNGGGVYNVGTLTLVHSVVSGNTTTQSDTSLLGGFGGGVYNAGTMTLRRSTIRGNTAADTGGGVYNAGTMTLRYSTVSGNTAPGFIGGGFGGGLSNAGTMTLEYSTVHSNTAHSGGGVDNQRHSPADPHRGHLTVVRSTVRGNTAGEAGGGVWNEGVLTLRQSTVRGNTADLGSGGGMSNLGILTVRLSTVSGNTAHSGGGMVNGSSATLTLEQSTVSGNTAADTGGGVQNFNTLRLSRTIIAGNTAGASGADCDQFQLTVIESQGDNLTGVGTGCPSNPAQGDLTVDPTVVFAQVLGPLQDNGGPTRTHALLPGSPALDTVHPSWCGGPDQRGVPRPQGAGCDIGAFELEVP